MLTKIPGFRSWTPLDGYIIDNDVTDNRKEVTNPSIQLDLGEGRKGINLAEPTSSSALKSPSSQ